MGSKLAAQLAHLHLRRWRIQRLGQWGFLLYVDEQWDQKVDQD